MDLKNKASPLFVTKNKKNVEGDKVIEVGVIKCITSHN